MGTELQRDWIIWPSISTEPGVLLTAVNLLIFTAAIKVGGVLSPFFWMGLETSSKRLHKSPQVPQLGSGGAEIQTLLSGHRLLVSPRHQEPPGCTIKMQTPGVRLQSFASDFLKAPQVCPVPTTLFPPFLAPQFLTDMSIVNAAYYLIALTNGSREWINHFACLDEFVLFVLLSSFQVSFPLGMNPLLCLCVSGWKEESCSTGWWGISAWKKPRASSIFTRCSWPCR